MSSRRTATAALAFGFALAGPLAARDRQDHATPQEAVQRVQLAAQTIAKGGEAATARAVHEVATAQGLA